MDLHCRSARFSRCFPHDESGQHFLASTRNNIVRKGFFIWMIVKLERITLLEIFTYPLLRRLFEEECSTYPQVRYVS